MPIRPNSRGDNILARIIPEISAITCVANRSPKFHNNPLTVLSFNDIYSTNRFGEQRLSFCLFIHTFCIFNRPCLRHNIISAYLIRWKTLFLLERCFKHTAPPLHSHQTVSIAAPSHPEPKPHKRISEGETLECYPVNMNKYRLSVSIIRHILMGHTQ